ncbi:monocarboxylate transporter 12-like isoform X1 [Mytilus galloprovincialis]|uniref:Blast:Monocarboxylate transporter 12 n=2 Tax=Mytilus galloprovincialis TaxID=29158 RepID=A0A8B6FV48_MYTGA|nr:blast:Monocarboxylate transporter 12 [Mytilus galloprovincialis]
MSTSPDRGWAWLVLLGSVGEHIVMGYLAYASGMIHIALLENFNADVLTTTWISALFLALMTGSGPIASTIINRYSCRVAMILGSLMLSTGLVLTGFVEDIKWTFFTFGILAGIGFGLCYNTGLIVIAFNFEKKRNMASGIAISGGGIGPFILTPVFQLIYEEYNYSGYFLLLGGLALQNCVFGAIFRPSKTELAMKTANSNRTESFSDSVSSYMEIVRSGSMLCVCLGFFLANISIYLLYIHYPEYCLHTKSTKMDVSIFLSIAGISGCVTRVLFGMANNSHNINELLMLFGVFSLLGFGTIIFPLFSSYTTAKVMFACLLGGYSGCCWAVVNSIVINILGHERLAHGVGYLMIYCGVGTFIGPPLAGVIINYGGTYGDSFIVAGILLIMGGFSCLCCTMCQGSVDTKESFDDFEFTVTADENTQTILASNKTDENDSFLIEEIKNVNFGIRFINKQ